MVINGKSNLPYSLRPAMCVPCGIIFVSNSALDAHMMSEHSDIKQSEHVDRELDEAYKDLAENNYEKDIDTEKPAQNITIVKELNETPTDGDVGIKEKENSLYTLYSAEMGGKDVDMFQCKKCKKVFQGEEKWSTHCKSHMERESNQIPTNIELFDENEDDTMEVSWTPLISLLSNIMKTRNEERPKIYKRSSRTKVKKLKMSQIKVVKESKKKLIAKNMKKAKTNSVMISKKDKSFQDLLVRFEAKSNSAEDNQTDELAPKIHENRTVEILNTVESNPRKYNHDFSEYFRKEKVYTEGVLHEGNKSHYAENRVSSSVEKLLFENRETMDVDQIKVLEELYPNRKVETPFVCETCGALFASLKTQQEHEHDEHSGLKRKCTICDLDFDNIQLQRQHRSTVHSKKRKCPDCGKMFHRTTLISHRQAMHLGYKPHASYVRGHLTLNQT